MPSAEPARGDSTDASTSAVSRRTPPPYEPYEFLIGEWEIAVEGREPAAVNRFEWGPKRTYIWWTGSYLVEGKEQPAWEGMMVWNGVRKRLDFLLTLELDSGGLVQEQGEFFVESDGTVVRDITVFYSEGNVIPPNWSAAAGPGGATAPFRHSFTPARENRILASVERESETGWAPSFPGSEQLVMTRRTAG